MCWLMNAWPSTTSVTLFLRSAPSASTGRVDRQRRHRARRVAPGAPQDRRPERTDPHHRVVHPPRDRTLADEEGVGEARQPASASSSW